MRFRIRNHVYFTPLFYYALGVIVFSLAMGQFGEMFFQFGLIALGLFILLIVIEALLLFVKHKSNFEAQRITEERFSNGDENLVKLTFTNNFPFPVTINVIDELPLQFQKRDFNIRTYLKVGETKNMSYHLRPTERGEYWFGALNVFIKSPLRLVERRIQFNLKQYVKVYPAFKEMRQFEMMAISNRLTEVGIKKIRRIGHQMEFDQIREYTKGDDYRTINWKATARRSSLMVNQYQDEKSQQVISIIDLGRTMKMPFEGMTLLDYAINASLVLSKIAMLKQDKAGLITFNNKVRTVVPPQRNSKQMQVIMEALYNQTTRFEEQSIQALYTSIRRNVHQRSLLVIYTNYESLSAAKRQLPMLQKLANDHMVVIVFFENTELKQLTDAKASDMEGIYVKTIAEKFAYDKKRIVLELERYGIHSVLTAPENLTVETINKYLELKARGYI
ncbi:DUF58 domain-containing protein [Carboxylicivirga sediminis]|uniref:DUF58 domain-containing protein n=1 Tax=Carboxylicivirga sediminis TaxID=2006564 RepID=A0A941F4A9_9BACT|nr:DUF58 domain-containing protein [Carboxylicivirga sediminis]MBR8536546.1 DUF58 domain-containing protein [Carboxylicivirga sediminis]